MKHPMYLYPSHSSYIRIYDIYPIINMCCHWICGLPPQLHLHVGSLPHPRVPGHGRMDGKKLGCLHPPEKKKHWMVTLYNQCNAVQCLWMFDEYDCFLNVFGDVWWCSLIANDFQWCFMVLTQLFSVFNEFEWYWMICIQFNETMVFDHA